MKTNLIKTTNWQTVLKCILSNSEFTKRSIESESEITFPTVSKIFDEMESKNIIEAFGSTAPANGRKAVVY